MYGSVRVQPDPRYIAEVVVLVTTLRAKRTEYNACKRVKDLLEIKRVHFKPIDFNRDARQAGSGESEQIAIKRLLEQGKLKTGENDELILPQVFIDGFSVGGIDDLQEKEDDDTLDALLLRRDPTRKVDEILPGMMTIEQALQEFCIQGREEEGDWDDDEEYESGECDEEEEEEVGGEPDAAGAGAVR
mmetsp:Transcript_30188/g.80439  ORF Transcript_30188/g.80439 Transcript_30188/m.80439 type:complete len:188 (+) Transcript_30188:126-689(+)